MASKSSCLQCLPCNISSPGPLLTVPKRCAEIPKLPSLKFGGTGGVYSVKIKKRILQKESSPLALRQKASELLPIQPLPSVDSLTTKSNEIFTQLQAKLLGGHYHALQHAFRTFAPQGTGAVTKCALYRLLCNFMPGLTVKNYNMLLKRINLDSKKAISFEEFYSKFRTATNIEKGWLSPITHCEDSLPWQFVYSQLQMKARKSPSSFCSNWINGQQLITKSAFNRYLDSVCLKLKKDQFDVLWKKFDQDNNGCLALPSLMECLGIQDQCDFTPGVSNLNVDEVAAKLMTHLREQDPLRYGKVRSGQLHASLSKAGLNISKMEVQKLLEKLGFHNTLVDYQKFVDQFISRKKGSITDHIMAINDSLPQKKSVSDGDAENSIVLLLQNKFLKLLAALKAHDPKNSGYIEKEDFKACVRELLPCEEKQLEDLTSLLCEDPDSPLSKVPYPKFLAMFESKESKVRQFSSRPLIQCHLHRKILPRVQPTVSPQLLEQVASLICCDLPNITKHFTDLDEKNTGKLTFCQTFNLLHKCGISTSEDELLPLWDSFLKNRGGTVSFNQLIKELGQISRSNNIVSPRKRLTEDHCFMHSKKLHRDEDMLMDTLRYKIVYFRDALLKHIASADPTRSGYISVQDFQKLLTELCPAFTEPEKEDIISKCQDNNRSCVNYIKMFSLAVPNFCPLDHVEGLLPQGDRDVTKHACTRLPLASKPVCGLPGVKRYLQRQLTKRWKDIRRLFKSVDSTGEGNISVSNFKKVLEHCGVKLDSEQLYNILEALDPNLSGLVNYQTFLNIIFVEG